mgnify:CR=1 FL=1
MSRPLRFLLDLLIWLVSVIVFGVGAVVLLSWFSINWLIQVGHYRAVWMILLGALVGVLVGTATAMMLSSVGGEYVVYECPEVRDLLRTIAP